MRTTGDRVRHALSFEIVGLLIVTPLGAWAFGMAADDVGPVALAGATIATLWNYVYNLLFDHAMICLRGGTKKSLPVRIAHAALFETGLLIVLLPYIAWYLGVSLRDAFLLDVSLALFYLVYAFSFNWAYDALFPLRREPAENV